MLGEHRLRALGATPLGLMLSAGTSRSARPIVGFAARAVAGAGVRRRARRRIGNGLEWPSLISLVQRLTPQRLHGRLMGAVESIGALCLAIGLPLGGALVALSSPRAAFLVVGSASRRDRRLRASDADGAVSPAREPGSWRPARAHDQRPRGRPDARGPRAPAREVTPRGRLAPAPAAVRCPLRQRRDGR